MLRPAVPRREDAYDLARVRDRFRRQHANVRLLVPVKDHLARAVRVHRPEVVVRDLLAVHVLPAHVNDLAIRERPRRIILLDVARELADVRPVPVAFVDRADLGQPAVYPALGAGRAEDDASVGAVRRLVVVPARGSEVAVLVQRRGAGAVLVGFQRRDPFGEFQRRVLTHAGNLLQARPVEVHFVKTVVLFPARQVRENELFAVVMDLHVADVPAFVLEDLAAFFRLHVVNVDRPAGVHREGEAAHVIAVVPERGVPVLHRGFTRAEKNFLRHSRLEERVEHGGLRRRGEFLGLFAHAEVVVEEEGAFVERDFQRVRALADRAGGNFDHERNARPGGGERLPRALDHSGIRDLFDGRFHPVRFDVHFGAETGDPVADADDEEHFPLVGRGVKLDLGGETAETRFRLSRAPVPRGPVRRGVFPDHVLQKRDRLRFVRDFGGKIRPLRQKLELSRGEILLADGKQNVRRKGRGSVVGENRLGVQNRHENGQRKKKSSPQKHRKRGGVKHKKTPLILMVKRLTIV